jgi:GR25 family glycosyltransferase involved in LPS biosynthesis
MPDAKNLDIFSIPLYYISFKKNKNIEDHYKYHGFKNINHFQAIDGRKLDKKELLKNGFITIRSFDDLMSGRTEHSGLPTLGAVGCTLSHYNLWRVCVDNNMPYIIIAEEDNKMFDLDDKDIRNIRSTLSKNKPVFISANTKKMDHRNHFFGTNFYIISKEACIELINKCFPMDVQTDWYMSNLSTIGDITLEGYKISKQEINGKSSIQDICVTCILPKNRNFYFIFICVLLLIIISVIYFWKKWKKCKKTCSV